jgi:flagellar biosynthesis protein FlhB
VLDKGFDEGIVLKSEDLLSAVKTIDLAFIGWIIATTVRVRIVSFLEALFFQRAFIGSSAALLVVGL